MPEKQKDKRSAPISYRPPAALREEFKLRVEKSGLSTSAFITKAVFDARPPRQSRRPALEQKLLARLLGEAAKIRSELHEIALSGGSNGSTLLIDRAVDELTEIRAALLKAMGRKP
ncbi:MAG: hypothetical protein HPY30_00865 [Gammaproteobacteria bacterium (ex Lamellibrachia satsuma)]|nr:MAG: hypothetical protein HPY30_00865 [Gammaproteobacteria bacterium (ex Lamellibrachia satsuma)]